MGKRLVQAFIILFCCGSVATWIYFLVTGQVAGKAG